MKVLLLSHGNLAKEMFETAKMIFGELKDFSYIVLPYGMDLTEYKEEIKNRIEESEQILSLVDLFGGSPFMISSQFLNNEKYHMKMEIVTGMNLSMVLEVACKAEDSELKELKEIAVNAGISGVCDLKERLG